MKKALVKIYSIWSKRSAGDNIRQYAYTVAVVRGATETTTLEAAFAATNRDDRPHGNLVCSTSVGDVMELDDKFYLVAGHGFFSMDPGHGFTALTKEEADRAMLLTSRDTGCGYAYLKKNNLI